MSSDLSTLPAARREPDFSNLLAVLHRERPARRTLYELFLNDRLYQRFCDPALLAKLSPQDDWLDRRRMIISAYIRAGYDYAHYDCPFGFPRPGYTRAASISQSENPIIVDRASFGAYAWPDPDRQDYSLLDTAGTDLPPKMKFVSMCPSGVLENVIALVGYEQLCLMVHDNPALVEDVFANVGKRLTRYQEIVSAHPKVGACMCNDDWGHRTQTLLSPEHHRKYVLPWHQRMIEAIHKNGKPAMLHSCGNLDKVMEDVIAIGFDAKHSYEDTICPIEAMYDRYSDRIATIGGIDLDFLCRRPIEEVKARCRAMYQRAEKGGYALGTGNSVPEYVPDERYCAMTGVAFEEN